MSSSGKYEDDDFEDDFESDSSSSSSSTTFSSASSHTPTASSARSSASASSKDNSVTASAKRSAPSSAATKPTTKSESSHSSSESSKSSSPSESKRSSHTTSAATSRTTTAESSRRTTETSHTATESTHPADVSTHTEEAPAQDTNPIGKQRAAKAPAKGAKKRAPSKKKTASTKARSMNQSQRSAREAPVEVEPAPVPRNQEELEDMLAENETLKEQILMQHTQMYKNQQTGATQTGGTFNKSQTQESKKDASARVVQESLLQQRLAQMLQKERKDLLAQKKQLEGQVAKYRKASKYRHHVEVAKKDIADLTDENRDLQLEVRCNEKLLVMNANVIESGEGHQRLAEELRAQNALTQRSLEHAVRDCTDAERQRDGVKQRVEALREKQADLKRSENGENDYNTLQRLREENRQKKNTISQLKQQLNVSQKQSYLGGQSAPSDAERSYLEERIAHMRLELERAKQQVRKASTPMANSAHAIEPPSEVAPASPPKQEAGWLNNSAANSPVHPAKDSSAQNEFRELEEPVEAPKQEDNYVQNTNTGFDFLTEDAPPPKPVKDIFADDDIFGTNEPAPTLAPAEPAKNDVPDWLAGDEDDAAGEGMEEEPLEDEVEDYVEEEEAAEEAKEEEKPAWLEF